MWLQLLIFLIKYGPSIFNLVKEIIELVKWLRENRKTMMIADNDTQLRTLHLMAKRCKGCGSNAELVSYRNSLQRFKAEAN